MNNQARLSVKNLTKNFFYKNKTLEVLDNITLYVNAGEFVSIIGPSGCGKSTLFNTIAGIETPTSGNITIDEKQDSKVGYMLQKPLLLPWKTVEQNVMLGLIIKGIPKDKAQKASLALLKKFGLQNFADHYPATISGGMAQRAALLRTILFNNTFLLMDEPFGALDALTRRSMQLWLLDVLKEYRSSVLFITHDIREAILLSDRIYVLSPRPAHIVKEIKVPFSHPKKRTILTQKETLQLEKELEEILLTDKNV